MRDPGSGGSGSQGRRVFPGDRLLGWALRTALGPALVTVAAVGCAHVEAPPGGPTDSIPPVVVRVRPDSLSVNPGFRGAVRFEFGERISERDVERSVLLAPAPGGVKVEKAGNSVKAEPRRGWQADRIYHATLLPIVADLFGNRMREPVTLVFSTGPEIPSNRLVGRVVDRVTGQGVRGVRVEARWLDGDVAYLALTDTAGAFRFAPMPPGRYLIVAFEDRNRNLTLEPFEPADSTALGLTGTDTASVRLRIVEPDTTPPVLGWARMADSVTARLNFDDPLDPEVPVDSLTASLRRTPDGPDVPILRVWHGFEYDRQRAAQDTTAPPPAPPTEAPLEPLPQRSLYLVLGGPLAPGEYEVRASGVRNLSGVEGGGVATLEVAEPPSEGPAP